MSPYTPTRSAPCPPAWPRPYGELPSDHPFLNPYTPRHVPNQLHRTTSTDSFYSDYIVQTPPTSPSSKSKSSSGYTKYQSDRSYTSPAEIKSSWLAQSLSPRPNHLDHQNFSRPRPIYPSSTSNSFSSSSPTRSFVPLPKELSIFDSRPRTNLLADLEFIAGKKLHFPFLTRCKLSLTKKEEKEKKRGNEKKEKTSPARLVKERRRSEEEEFLFDIKAIRQDSLGRGVREGNWI